MPRRKAASPARSVQLTDPRALRAVAHPVRLDLIALLRREGPLTATQAAARIGQGVANTSFHLRQLAKHGLVEEAGGGRGRERPWRATAEFTSWPIIAGTPEMAAASGLLSEVIADIKLESLGLWLESRTRESAEWQEAAQFGDVFLYLTAAELKDLAKRRAALSEPYLERTAHPELRPAGGRFVTVLDWAFPVVEGQTGR